MVLSRVGRLAKVRVRGVVQGVGFRPFIYRLAHEYALKGWVRNTSGSVEIEVEGSAGAIDSFLDDLKAKAPPMSHIESVEVSFDSPRGYADFQIEESLSQEGQYQLVSPDIATCEDCRREIFSPTDRRFGYPFTNCTNCGPRFTIIEDIPYDRPKTTMRKFTMCPQCQQEYADPLNRRFHAQPNACPECGPKLELLDEEGKPVECADVIKMAAELLREGRVLAIKGLGGFHLACDATNDVAVNTLRARKRRWGKPLAVMIASLPEIEEHCFVSEEERKLLCSPQCPIVLLRWKHNSSSISPAVAPNLKYLGVMLPYTPLHHLLLAQAKLPLVMTSGNISEEPIAKDNDEALRRLGGIADYFLVHNRDIYARYDDSVYLVEGGPRVVRRARGYAPYPIFLPFRAKQILACGAELKNTFCLTKDEHAFLSQHIGDMENEETLEHFENTIKLYQRLFRIQPEVIAHDAHPDYLATRYALRLASELGLSRVPVQHHHAHIVSCLVDNKARGPVIGVAFDGTGYGSDGKIWGGEFLVADYQNFQRVGHLEYVPMPGGEVAIRKPYRMALGYIYSLLGEDFSLEGLPFQISPSELEVIKQQLRRGVNCPLTSSAGRLFDVISALAGVRGQIDYEAQAAIELEMQAPDGVSNLEPYPFSIVGEGGVWVVRLKDLILAVIDEVRKRTPVPEISLRFHQTMAGIITQMCQLVSRDTGIKQVALSGGVFQNRLLLRLVRESLEEGFDVLSHHLVPCNDGGISLGQAVIAHFNKEAS